MQQKERELKKAEQDRIKEAKKAERDQLKVSAALARLLFIGRLEIITTRNLVSMNMK